MIETINNKTVPFTNVSSDFKFSSAVAWFGLKLRDSKLLTNKDTKNILTLAQEAITNDKEGYKTEFIRLVETVQ